MTVWFHYLKGIFLYLHLAKLALCFGYIYEQKYDQIPQVSSINTSYCLVFQVMHMCLKLLVMKQVLQMSLIC